MPAVDPSGELFGTGAPANTSPNYSLDWGGIAPADTSSAPSDPIQAAIAAALGGGGGGSGYQTLVDTDGTVTGVPGATYQVDNNTGHVTILSRPPAARSGSTRITISPAASTGAFQIVTDPTTGQLYSVNKVTGESTPIGGGAMGKTTTTGIPAENSPAWGNGYNPKTGLPWGVITSTDSPSGYLYQGQAVNPDGSVYTGSGTIGPGAAARAAKSGGGGSSSAHYITRADGSVWDIGGGTPVQILGPDKSPSSGGLRVSVPRASSSGSSAAASAAIRAASSAANAQLSAEAAMARQTAAEAFQQSEAAKAQAATARNAALQRSYDAAALNANLQQKYGLDQVTKNNAYLKALESTDPLSFAAFLDAGGGNISNAIATGHTALSQADILAGARAKEALDQPYVPFTWTDPTTGQPVAAGTPGAVPTGTSGTPAATGTSAATPATGTTATTTPPASVPTPAQAAAAAAALSAASNAAYQNPAADAWAASGGSYNPSAVTGSPYDMAGALAADAARNQFLAANPGPHAAYTPPPGFDTTAAGDPWQSAFANDFGPATPATVPAAGLAQVPGQTQTAGVPVGGTTWDQAVAKITGQPIQDTNPSPPGPATVMRQARGGLRKMPAYPGSGISIVGDTPSGRPDGHEEALMGNQVIPHPQLVQMMGGQGGLKRALQAAPASGAPVPMPLSSQHLQMPVPAGTANTQGLPPPNMDMMGSRMVAGGLRRLAGGFTMAPGYDLSGISGSGVTGASASPAATTYGGTGSGGGMLAQATGSYQAPKAATYQAPAATAAPVSSPVSAPTTAPTAATGSTATGGGSSAPSASPAATTTPSPTTTPTYTPPAPTYNAPQTTTATPTAASTGLTPTTAPSTTATPSAASLATVPTSGYGVSPITNPTTLGITPTDQSYMQAVAALRQNTQIPNVNPYDIGWNRLGPTVQGLYNQGLQDAYGVPVADSVAQQKQYALLGLRRQPIYGSENRSDY